MKSKMMQGLGVAMVAAMSAGASAQDISVQVDSEGVNFRNQQPVYISGRVLVPLRGVFEKMGAQVFWRPAIRTVDATRGTTNVSLRIGEKWASINGETLAMDVPAEIINGSTMVPIRFLSEALGAQVTWNDAQRLVSITTTGNTVASAPDRPKVAVEQPRTTRRFTLAAGTVFPVTLQTRVSSKESRVGDTVRASLGNFSTQPENWEQGRFHFPPGTVLEGSIVSAIPKEGDQPGVIEMAFDRIVFPDGRSNAIDGSLIGLDDKSVERNENGVLVAKKTSGSDNRMVYTGYGAGAGLLVGLLSDRPLEKTALGGLLGFLVGSLSQTQRQAHDVNLEPGTEFGVKLDASATLTVARRNPR